MKTVSFPSLLPMGRPLTLQIQNAPTQALAIRAAVEHLAAERTPLQHLDLSYLDLSQAHLDGLQAEYCRFNDSNLSGASVCNATLQNCDFQNIATSSQTNLTGSTFLVCDFSGALLNGVQAAQTTWNGTKFKGAHCVGLVAPESNFKNCRTVGMNARGETVAADFRGAVLSWSDISNMEGRAGVAAVSAGTDTDRAMLRLFNDRGCSPMVRADLEHCYTGPASTQ